MKFSRSLQGFGLFPFVSLRILALVICVVLAASHVCGQELANWPAPATWAHHSASRGASTMGAVTSPLPFIGVTPCRVLDTRNAVGPFGGPAFSSGQTRSFIIPAGPCSGIPPSAEAYSLNFTVVDMLPGDGFLTAWPTGTAQPVVSTLDYVPVVGAIANAAVVPSGSGGAINVFVNIGTNVIIDINGYYAAAGIGTHNTFLGLNAGNFTMVGDNNTGLGHSALFSVTMGTNNTATGHNALTSNDTGSHNTASGSGALISNAGGIQNTATGSGALFFNVLGSGNTASGAAALGNTTGDANIGIGSSAGINLTTGSNDICIGNSGVAGESDTIRIGRGNAATRIFVDGIRGRTTGVADAIPVVIDSNGQLGTVSSSRRLKEDIQDMDEASLGLMKLRPVTFRYKVSLDPTGSREYGLIAEEVAEAFPDLVVFDNGGQPETVRYHVLVPMLLNEVQRDRKTIADLAARLERLEALMSEARASSGIPFPKRFSDAAGVSGGQP